ncbi:cytochrome c-type biogenesis protein CcmH [Edaphobacter sp. DSM 109919]|uniref:Cytochrome c-type biogenesis protein n=1 Tax=Edaphobacter paludis TaxID=3035702 RepID=A0AAU7CYL7_9BACT
MSLKRWMQSLTVCLLAVVMLGASDGGARFSRLGHQMVCACSCGQILLECNHVSCPDSGPMIDQLRAQMAAGGSDTSIFNWFAAKYGPTVLAAPIRGGFDDVAWIAPFAVFFFATLGTGILIYFWKRRSLVNVPPASATGISDTDRDAMRERIRRETEY